MFFGSSTKKRNKTTNHIVIDIGSGSVGAGLLVLGSSGKEDDFALTKIIRKEIRIDEGANLDDFVLVMNKSLKDCLSLVTANSGKVDDIHIFLSSPWYASQSRDVKIKKEKPFTITKKYLVELLKKEETIFENTFLKKYEGMTSGIKIIERKVLDTKINGYHTPDAVGKESMLFEISLFFSMSPKDIIDSIYEIAHKICQRSKIYFHSSSFSMYMSLRDLLLEKESFLICDIGSELTEVSSVSGGVLIQSSSFPVGTEVFIKEVMKNENKNKLESLSSIRMHSEDTLSDDENERFSKSIKGAEDKWTKSFTKALESISTAGYVPRHIYLFTKSDTKAYFERLIKNEPLYSKQGVSPFSVIPVDSMFLSELVKVSSSENRDVSLMISSYYMVKYINHHQLQYAENY